VNCENCGSCPSDCLCNDGIACTNDSCQANACVFSPNNAKCDDDNVCNGLETCVVASGGCVDGPDLICDNGLFCDGEETCDPQIGCVPGTPPCDVDCTCDEEGDLCVCSIPTMSEWGLVTLGLLLLIGAKLYFSRRMEGQVI
jgi:hypothetical protein